LLFQFATFYQVQILTPCIVSGFAPLSSLEMSKGRAKAKVSKKPSNNPSPTTKSSKANPAKPKPSSKLSVADAVRLQLIPKARKAFALFTAQHPSGDLREVSAQWKALSEAQRQEYKDKSSQEFAKQQEVIVRTGLKIRTRASSMAQVKEKDQQQTQQPDLQTSMSTRLGRFELPPGPVLGAGAYGAVATVVDDAGRQFAAKLGTTEISALAMRREMKILNEMAGHPNFLPLLDAGERGPLTWFVTPKLVSARSCGRLRGGAFDAFGKQLMLSVGALHAKGYLHCDVKPHNVLWRHQDHHLFLIDFGISCSWPLKEQIQNFEVYTPQYRAAELWLSASVVSPASDAWAVACTLFEVASGGKLVPATTPIEIRMIMKRYEQFRSLSKLAQGAECIQNRLTKLANFAGKDWAILISGLLHPNPGQRRGLSVEGLPRVMAIE
jgi:hypothetical protein